MSNVSGNDNKELANVLLTLAIMCKSENTNECDVNITTSMGDINCHIEFETGSETYNKKSHNTALRVYNDTLDECTCGNCLGYINKGYNYCPQCGARLED